MTPSDYPFHQRKRVRWQNIAIGVAIPLITALLTLGFTTAVSAWNGKANVSDVREINKKLDDIIIRVTQIQCGKRVEDGCR